MKKTVNRRTILKGAGVALALPIFESTLPRVSAATNSNRPIKRMVCLSNNYGVYQKVRLKD